MRKLPRGSAAQPCSEGLTPPGKWSRPHELAATQDRVSDRL